MLELIKFIFSSPWTYFGSLAFFVIAMILCTFLVAAVKEK